MLIDTQETIPTALYHQFKGLIYKAARRSAFSCGLPVEDLAAEAKLIFCEAVRSYRPDMGASFCTHLTHRLRTLSHYTDRELLGRSRYVSIGDQVAPGQETTLEDVLGELDAVLRDKDLDDVLPRMKTDAQTLAGLVLDGDFDAPKKTNKARRGITCRGAYQRRTRLLGWTWDRHLQAWASLRADMAKFRRGSDFAPIPV